MDVEMNEKMNQIMELMHQITGYFIDFAKSDISGKEVSLQQIENNKIIKTLFERMQKYYRELQSFILEDSNVLNMYKKFNEINESDSIATIKEDEDNIPTAVNYLTLDDLESYLENSYIELNYISFGESGESIYKEFDKIRHREYSLQVENLQDIGIRGNIQGQNKKRCLSFKEKADIIRWISRNKFFEEYAFNKIEQCIKVLKEKYKYNQTDGAIRKINGLIEQKYILYLEYLNNKYNGLLQENDIGILAVTKGLINQGAETVALNMTQFEIDENIKINIEEDKKIFKDIVKTTVKSTRVKENDNYNKKSAKRNIKKIAKAIRNNIKEKVKIDGQEEEK